MGNVIPTAATYGISLEDLSSAYVVLTRQGINTARATTYLRSAFTELEKTESDSAKALKAYTNKTFMQLMKEGYNLGEVMQMLKNSVGGNDEAFIHLFGSIRSGAGALALANTSSDEYNKILKEVSYSAGQTARNVEKLNTPSLKFQKAMNQLKLTATDFGQTLMELLLPYFEQIVAKIREWTDAFKSLSTPTKQLIVKMAGLAAGLGPVLSLLGGGVSGITDFALKAVLLKKNLGGATTGLAGFANKMLGLLPGIAGGVAVVAALTAGIAVFGGMLNESKQKEIQAIREQYKFNDALQETVSNVDTLKKSYDDYRKSAVEKLDVDTVDRDVISKLRDQYNLLLDDTGQVKSGNEELAAFYKEGLAGAMDITIEQLDEMIAQHGSLDAAVDHTIEKMKEEAQMAVYKEWLIEATRAHAEAEREYNKLIDERSAALEVAKNAQEKANEAQAAYEQAQLNHADNTEVLRQEFERLNEEAGIAHQKWVELDQATNTAGQTVEQTSYDLNQISDIIDGKVSTSTNNLIDDVKGVTKATADEVGVTKDGVIKDTTEAVDTVNDKVDEAKRDLPPKIQDIAKEFDVDLTTTGENMVEGYINGFMSKQDRALMQARALAHNVKTVMEQEGKIGSPSKVMDQIGQYYGQGFINGLAKYVSPAGMVAAELADATFPDTSWTSNYSRLPDTAYGTTNNTRNISAPIAVNVSVNGSVDDPNALADVIEQRLVEKIINNERVFA